MAKTISSIKVQWLDEARINTKSHRKQFSGNASAENDVAVLGVVIVVLVVAEYTLVTPLL